MIDKVKWYREAQKGEENFLTSFHSPEKISVTVGVCVPCSGHGKEPGHGTEYWLQLDKLMAVPWLASLHSGMGVFILHVDLLEWMYTK